MFDIVFYEHDKYYTHVISTESSCKQDLLNVDTN